MEKIKQINSKLKKISQSLKGQKKSPESVEKMRKKLIGNSNSKGSRPSTEAKRKMSIAASKRIGSKNAMYEKTLYNTWI